jgi:hypothetical protein
VKILLFAVVALALVIGTTGMLVVPMSAGTAPLVTVRTQPMPPDWHAP